MQSGFEEWVAIGSQHDFPRLEIERENSHILLWYAETINYGIGDILVLHRFEHVRDNGLPRCIVDEELFLVVACVDDIGTLLRQLGLIGLGIIVVFTANQTLAVAYHPDFPAQSTKDDAGSGESFFRMLGESFHMPFRIMLGNGSAGTITKLVAGDVLWALADELGDDVHGIATVATEQAIATSGFRSGAIDDGNEIRSYDDSVLAFFLWVLRNDVLLYNFHYLTGLMGDRVMVALGIAS